MSRHRFNPTMTCRDQLMETSLSELTGCYSCIFKKRGGASKQDLKYQMTHLRANILSSRTQCVPHVLSHLKIPPRPLCPPVITFAGLTQSQYACFYPLFCITCKSHHQTISDAWLNLPVSSEFSFGPHHSEVSMFLQQQLYLPLSARVAQC